MENTTQREATLEEAIQLGLTTREFEMIKVILGRIPNFAEINIFGVIWSEEHSFKNSCKYLKDLPTIKGVGFGDGTMCELKVTSNTLSTNTESPTRLVTRINSFRFGNLEENRVKDLIKELVKSQNIDTTPTIGQDVFFDDSFNNKPMLNTFTVGIVNPNENNAPDPFENTSYSKRIRNVLADALGVNENEINVVKENENIQYFQNDLLLADLPINSLIVGEGTPDYTNKYTEPAYFKEYKSFNIDNVREPDDLREVATFLLKHPNISSRRWFSNQAGTVSSIPENTNTINIDGKNSALAMSVGCNPRYINADPEIGTSIGVAEAARKIVCTGGVSKAISFCMNFGNQNNPESFWQFVNSIQGIATACKRFNTPVSDKIVSFSDASIKGGTEVSPFPSSTIGMIGLIENKNKVMTPDFKHKGDLIFIIGEAVECIASSEYLYSYHGIKASPAPYFNMDKEFEMQEVVKTIIQKELINAAHDCSAGGIFITLTEMAIPRELGFDIVSDAEIREDAFLFGEASGRVLVGVNEDSEDDFIEFMMDSGVNFTLLGHVTQGKMVVDDEHYGFIQAAKLTYNSSLEKLIEQ
ncbi:MAG TPA: AIR synthase-related protein [Brumimicrobium sp.]|nr:AIR synthase-related protein [Brumimicrobium sp.]